MKKHVTALAVLAAGALFLSACGGGGSEPRAQEPAAADTEAAKTITAARVRHSERSEASEVKRSTPEGGGGQLPQRGDGRGCIDETP
jgi:outer membrane lipoprotein-sorting protein